MEGEKLPFQLKIYLFSVSTWTTLDVGLIYGIYTSAQPMKLAGNGGRASHMHTIAAESFLSKDTKRSKVFGLPSMLFIFSLVIAVTLWVCTELKFLNF